MHFITGTYFFRRWPEFTAGDILWLWTKTLNKMDKREIFKIASLWKRKKKTQTRLSAKCRKFSVATKLKIPSENRPPLKERRKKSRTRLRVKCRIFYVCAQVHFTLSGIKLRNLRSTIFLPAFSHNQYQTTISTKCMNFFMNSGYWNNGVFMLGGHSGLQDISTRDFWTPSLNPRLLNH